MNFNKNHIGKLEINNFNLVSGINILEFRVESEDRETIQNYRIKVELKLNTNAYLNKLIVSSNNETLKDFSNHFLKRYLCRYRHNSTHNYLLK